MYKTFYELNESPFSIQPDPDFLYFSRLHTYAYSMMEYGIKNKAGFIVVSGEIGCGKTTLIRYLLNNLADNLTVGLVYNTHKNIANLLEWIMLALGLPYEGKSQVALFDMFQRYLIDQYKQGRSVLLIIDEAQNLSPDALEALRMLSNINADKHQLLQMMLVGQPQLKELLTRPEMLQFAQRIEADFHIKPFAATDVQNYIQHRLEVSGRFSPLFTPEACARIAEVTKGIPRRINVLCNMALVYGYSAEARMIDKSIIDEVIKDKIEYGALSSTDE